MSAFRSVRHALVWYVRAAATADGARSLWPSQERLLVAQPPGQAGDAHARRLTLQAIALSLARVEPQARRALIEHHVYDVPILDIAARWRRHPSRVYSRLQRAGGLVAARLRAEGLLVDRRAHATEEPCQSPSS